MPIDASEERLSKYELVRPLGSGGWGEVYLARDRVLQRQVAIKFVSSARLADPDAERRLVREARAAAALDHPAICSVYDVLTDKGRTCIVMQYVDGETLAERLKRGQLDPSEAVTLALRIAEALAAAHAAGVVHRDLKPQNVMLMHDGRPKLLDFGIAQTHFPPDVIASVETHTATGTLHTGAIVGTPAYMSPEQVLRKSVDGRSDLFSLGAVLYECLTAQPAFLAATDVETWARVVYAAPPAPSSINRAVTPEIDAIVAKLLAKEPGDRFASAVDAVAALQALGGRGTREGMSPRKLAFASAAVILAIALTGFMAWRFTRPRMLTAPPPDAAKWYAIGTEHLREGAYYSAESAFEEAVKPPASYPQAWAGLAEAQAELDDSAEALRSLLRASDLLKTGLVPAADRDTIESIDAFVRRDFALALARYQKIAAAHPSDPGAWLDVGRVSEAADSPTEAKAAYERAVGVQPQYAPAHLRLGRIAATELRKSDALREFAEAERLYIAASDYEGRTETLLLRASLLVNIGDLEGARQNLSSASALAETQKNAFQQVRARFILSDVTLKAGRFSEAARIAEDAAQLAVQHGLGTLAAQGLIETGKTRLQSTDRDVAGAKLQIQRGIEAARQLGASRLVALGALVLGSAFVANGQSQDAINVVGGVLPFLRDGRYRRWQLNGALIMSRAYEALGQYSPARDLAEQARQTAVELGDKANEAYALDSLAGLAAASGSLPAALRLRKQLETLDRAQQNQAGLPFDLTNSAELLIRLGRFEEADAALKETEAGIDAHIDAYVGRTRRVLLLRAMAASIQLRFDDAMRHSEAVLIASQGKPLEPSARLALVLRAYARACLHRPIDDADRTLADKNNGPIVFLMELRYWRASARLAQHDPRAAVDEATAALAMLDKASSSELEWRLAALASAAARQLNDRSGADAFSERAASALSRLRQNWQNDAVSYVNRPDLVAIRKAAGLS
jgi:tetratricopeptide (TPR) repeat protein/predicted Ser/Thr protein kinase